MFRQVILMSLKKATGLDSVEIDVPAQVTFGDYSSNAAMQAFGAIATKTPGVKLHKHSVKASNPREYAQLLIEQLQKDDKLMEIVEKIDIAGPGFINFFLKKEILIEEMYRVLEKGSDYGRTEIGKGQTVVIDYSAPNIAKPFGIGHLRSTVIGQALYNLYGFLGYKTVGDNHLGDWGTQFGKIIYMIQEHNVDPESLTIDEMERLYVEFHKLAREDESLEDKGRLWFKKLEDKDPEAIDLWKKCIEISLKEFERIYSILNVTIDYAYGESYYEDEMKEMVKEPQVLRHIQKGERGATIIDLSQYGIKVPLMFAKSDGTTTYATRDLATIRFRMRTWNPIKIIYEVSVEQELHFKQVFAAARILELVPESVELFHTNHGWYLGPDGKKFSTRAGKTVRLEEVLEEAIDRAKKLGSPDDETAKVVGVGAIKYFDLMRAVRTDVIFDWEKVMNMDGNSGPYLQYTYARTQSVLEKAQGTGNKALNETRDPSAKSLMPNTEELSVLRLLPKFSEVVQDAAQTYSPNLLCNYLYDLSQRYNAFYNKHRILESENDVKDFRLGLTQATGTVLKNGLKLLGIESPEKM